MTKQEISEISQEYGTPLFLYDGDQICKQCRILKECLYEGANLFYAMKANPLIGICQLLYSENCGIETASKGEIQTALRAGIASSNIIFNSPGKTAEEIDFAIEKKIKLISIESFEEAELVNKIAKEKKLVVEAALRVNQNKNFSKAKVKMTGVSSQFGIEETDLTDDLFKKISELTHIRIVGIQVYSGTQVLNAEEILRNAEYVIQLALRLSAKYHFELKYLNLGGGFGVPYFKGETTLDAKELKRGMQELKKCYGGQLKSTEIIFESGRFLLAESGVFVTKILYRKQSKGIIYYICDGGSNFHSSTAFMGRFVRNNFPMYGISEVYKDEQEMKKVNVVGPLCTPTDTIGQKVELCGKLNPGDLVVVEKSGAYGLTYSPINFLSHTTPAEVLKWNENVMVLRERGDVKDLWERQNELL